MLLLLRHSQFRTFWIAGAFGDLSLIAYFAAHGWLVLQITDSPLWVGISSFLGGLTMVVFSPIGGVVIDRVKKVRAAQVAGLFRGIGAAAIAALIFSDSVQLWHVLLFPIASGITASVRIPGLMALSLDIVGRKRLVSATAARMVSMMGMGVLAPLAIGRVVDGAGMGWAYAAMAAGDLISVGLLTLVNPPVQKRADKSSPFKDLKEGALFSMKSPLVRTLLGAILLNELFGWSHEPMLPVMARDVLGMGATGLGNLLAAGSLGAAATSVVLSSFENPRKKGVLLVAGMFGYGFFLLMFSLSRSVPLSLAMLGLAYGTAIVYETMVNTMLQTGVPYNMRGRVLSFQSMLWGVTGMTGFHTGALATFFGAPLAVGVGAVIVMLNALRLIPRAPGVEREAELASDGLGEEAPSESAVADRIADSDGY